ncbi:hypothetical protein BEWA_008720 [Theileria equi strain WA]|uniref:BRCT domain-containing protein n=1 Tax=Theileria equi strain WA TaxID=1537102 RepID=L0B0X1_THEEQ|nr:hypothetical protein BEWA_008720 [Theileria equi strain WA]AFZ81460.1 hypothetical protein BEWA_008720 [Theileria equi strain WA]|eukprot:XP_004831126.1 hypothetical protein BEWA_008720 [Theileria equi strain WA]
MPISTNSVYNSVFLEDRVFYNVMEDGLWYKKIICLVGFDDTLEECKALCMHLLTSLIDKGASVLKYPNKNLDSKLSSAIDYYLCNYSMGYDIRPKTALDSKFVTPIWLYSCSRDDTIYNTNTLPIFKANLTFYPLKFAYSGVKISVFGASRCITRDNTFRASDSVTRSIDSQIRYPSSFPGSFESGTNSASVSSRISTDNRDGMPSSFTKPAKVIKYNLDTIARFIRHCGFTYMDCTAIRNGTADLSGTVYFLLCRSMDEDIDQSIVELSDRIPCISIEWLYDTYISGKMENINKYLVKLDFYDHTNMSVRKRKLERKRSIYHNKVLCFSYLSAIENGLSSNDYRDIGALNVYIVNPVYVLAPWAIEEVSCDKERQMYNNISLIDDKQLMLFLSKEECKNNGLGLFAELSLLLDNALENDSRCKRLNIRNIKVYTSPINKTPREEDLLQIPSELIEGQTLINYIKSGKHINTFNLYDLADSITFVEVENLSQYQDEAIEESNRQLHAR